MLALDLTGSGVGEVEEVFAKNPPAEGRKDWGGLEREGQATVRWPYEWHVMQNGRVSSFRMAL